MGDIANLLDVKTPFLSAIETAKRIIMGSMELKQPIMWQKILQQENLVMNGLELTAMV